MSMNAPTYTHHFMSPERYVARGTVSRAAVDIAAGILGQNGRLAGEGVPVTREHYSDSLLLGSLRFSSRKQKPVWKYIKFAPPDLAGNPGAKSRDPNAVCFFKTFEEHGEFSNFAKYGFEVDGKYWPTSEHYYQAQKYLGTDDFWGEAIRQAGTAKLAAQMGRDSGHVDSLRPDWEQVKVDVMRKAVYHKFKSNPEILEKLLATGDKVLLETSPNDSFWGVGVKYKGTNHLGESLMAARERLRKEQSAPKN